MPEPTFKDLWNNAKVHKQTPLYYVQAVPIVVLLVIGTVRLFEQEWQLGALSIIIALTFVHTSKITLELLWYRHQYNISEDEY